MRRPQRLSRRLLAVIVAIAVVLLTFVAVLLVTIRDLRTADEDARRVALVMVAAREVETALSELESAERGIVLGGARYVPAWERAVRTLRATSRELLRTTAPGSRERAHAAALVARVQRHVSDYSRPLVQLARDDPAAARRRILMGADQRHDERIQSALESYSDSLESARGTGRARVASRARLAELVALVGVLATLSLVVGLIAFVRRAVLRPLTAVAGAARALADGDLRARVPGRRGQGEVAELASTFDTMASSLEDSRNALERRNSELAAQSIELVDAVRSAREGASVLRAVLDATPDAIALLDARGAILVDNPPMRAVRAAFGARATAIDDQGTLVPLDAPDGPAEARDEITLLGTRRAFARYAAPVHDSSGRLIGRLLVLREITREREADRVKEEFFALISHELRTPLTAILGYVELILGEDEHAMTSEHRHYLEIVERNAQRLLRLVGDLLFAAQVESGTLLLEPGTVDLPQLVRDAVEAAAPRAEEAGIALLTDLAPLPPGLGDRDRVAQVLDNLVTNALKFTPPGGRVTVRLAERAGTALITVADTGVGIPSDELPRLFDRFYRASNATARAVPGIGLGLMIVRAIVEAHDGTVTVKSEVGGGTTFTVTLPLRPVPRDEQPALTADHGPADLRRYSAGGR